jgi:hypothetical protein
MDYELDLKNITIILFHILDDVIERFVPIARLDFSMKEDVLHYKISNTGCLWILMTNKTLNVFQKIKIQNNNEEGENYYGKN